MRFVSEKFRVEYVHPLGGEFIDILGVDSEGSGTRLTPEEAMSLRNQLSVEIGKVGRLRILPQSWDMEYRNK